ncbi:acyltransferase family protein [Thalassotalea sp. ND16A]|uniref:acyltransferase family protein n=1 Tax=Thalassotalea sp. ND16A TaxID=1535422 RepID=UPI00051A5675|nr:acyltransferase [Thalassotalea sp. ND16A]KGJ94240.1 hypothetical protein ND16A_1446 [Thalassotalea sp. ND16A]
MFLQSIANFRAIAIILIVMGHLYSYGFVSEDQVSSTLKIIITGNTALFVFISGFMFHSVFYSRFEYKRFMINKFKNIIVPYFILATIAVLLLYNTSSGFFSTDVVYEKGILFEGDDSNLVVFIKYFITGKFLMAYWYIPFVILIFFMSNLHYKFINISIKYQILIITLLSVISIFIHRPTANANPLQALVYYTPIYLIGIFTSINADVIKERFGNKLILLLLIVIVIAIVQYYTDHIDNYTKSMFEYGGFDLMFIQKVFLCVYLYLLLEKFSFNYPLVNVISNTSFAIFFIHPWFIMVCGKLYVFLYGEIGESDYYFSSLTVYFIMLFATLSFSVASALLVKKLFKNDKRTRYLIGY